MNHTHSAVTTLQTSKMQIMHNMTNTVMELHQGSDNKNLPLFCLYLTVVLATPLSKLGQTVKLISHDKKINIWDL